MTYQKLIAPTGHYAVVYPLQNDAGKFAWGLYAADGALIRADNAAVSERAAKRRARQDLITAAYWPARPPDEMRRAQWVVMDGDAELAAELGDDWLCTRYVDLLTDRLTDMARKEVERNYAPVRLADRKFGVRIVGLHEGRMRLLEYKTLTQPEFALLVLTMGQESSGERRGAMVV